jgi:short-chain fatty acids transporter
LICIFLGCYLIGEFRSSPQGALAVLDLNIYNLLFIVIGMLMHWRPKQFLRAVADCIPATGGLIMQFPFYAVIFGMMVGTGISDWMAHLFGRIPSTGLFTIAVAVYSAVLGVFIPSGGSKWIIEAPYLLQAAHLHHVNLGWIVVIYNAAEALPNLVNPFLMLPVLGILKMKARDLVGYTVLQMFLHIPIVVFCCWFFERYIPYVPALR